MKSCFSLIGISLHLIWYYCPCEGEKTQFFKREPELEVTEKRPTIQSKDWQHHLINYTFPVFLQNINAKNGDKYDVESNENIILSQRLQSIVPPLALIFDSTNNSKCREDSETFLKHLNNLELWALKMYDSSGKFPSGLLNGNINQFGDFDECLSVNEPKLNIKGRYCLAYLQIRFVERNFKSNLKLHRAFKLMQSHFFFRSKLTDPGHRIPRFSTLNWGLCIPHSCSFKDIELHLKNITENFINGTGIDVEVKVEPQMCKEKEPFRAPLSFITVSCLFLLIVILSLLATLNDYFHSKASSELSNFAENSDNFARSFLLCFSLKKNIKSLLSTCRKPDDIKSIHGIRMANALMLLLCHKSMALLFIPYSNRTAMVENLSQPWSLIARIASLYTDTFVMLSGLLTSYSFIKTFDKNGKLDLKAEYLNRLIRIIPPLVALILTSTFIIPELGSGPQWNLLVHYHAHKCQQNWWKNLLFMQNYFGFENMCLTHTHHVSIDTQLFFISPFLVYVLFKWPLYGVGGLAALGALSTLARYETTMQRNLSFFIYSGIEVSRMFDTANHSYIIPFHRLTCYIIGILFGFVLRRYGVTIKLKSAHLRFCWAVAFTFISYILSKAYDMNRPDYVYDNREAAIYAALAPVAWCMLIGWTIFVCQVGFGGVLNKLISSKYFIIWTRLSYAVYLTQFPIFFFNVGWQRYPQQYSIFMLINILEILSILGISAMWTLLFEMPFANLKNVLMQR